MLFHYTQLRVHATDAALRHAWKKALKSARLGPRMAFLTKRFVRGRKEKKKLSYRAHRDAG